MTVSEPEPRPSLGPVLPLQMGRFTLAEELGAGGMATVYLGKMKLGAGLDRLVAVKTIHGHLAKKQAFVDMFLDEARIASMISHPNVCAVHDFGQEEGVYFLAMEHLLGEPLFDAIGAIDRDRGEELMQAVPFLAARIIADACEGLHAAHTTKGNDGTPLAIVHRDVSPQNIFVTYEGTVKIVDFGCAKALERVTQTNTGIMKGKVSYAAPEQLRAEEIDRRADVFALGVCLWETLCLRPLFRRDTAIKTAMAVLEEPTPRADEGRPWVPKALADIAEKALSTEPEDRYESAREMGRDLRNWIARSGQPFESAEVAEWMDYLFADRYEKRRTVVKQVEALDASVVQPVSAVEEALAGPAANADEPADDDKPQTLRFDTDDQPAGVRGGRFNLVLAALLLVVGGALAAWLFAEDQVRALLRMPSDEVPVEEAGDPEEPPAAVVDEHDSYEGIDMVFEPNDVTVEPLEDAPPATEEETPAVAPEASAMAAASPMRERRRSRRETGGEASEAEEVARAGALRVRAIGGYARVVYQGNDLGRTPVRFDLPPGTHSIQVLPNGEEPGQTFQVRIEAGTLKTIQVQIPGDRAPAREPEPGPSAMGGGATGGAMDSTAMGGVGNVDWTPPP